MSRMQLSRAGRQVRRVKTAPHHREEALIGYKRGEGMAKLTEFDACQG